MPINYLNHIEFIDHLIHIKGTGTPKEFATRLSVSERTLYNYLSVMKKFGAPIAYCKSKRSYYYKFEGRFILQFSESEGDRPQS